MIKIPIKQPVECKKAIFLCGSSRCFFFYEILQIALREYDKNDVECSIGNLNFKESIRIEKGGFQVVELFLVKKIQFDISLRMQDVLLRYPEDGSLEPWKTTIGKGERILREWIYWIISLYSSQWYGELFHKPRHEFLARKFQFDIIFFMFPLDIQANLPPEVSWTVF